MASLDERLAAGRALADEAWARTVRAMYEGGGLLYPIEDDGLDRRWQVEREAEDEWRDQHAAQ